MHDLKFSRQRQSIKDYLASTKSHPTADTVYHNVRKKYPKISLGTVYRNLTLLSDLGEAQKISTPDGVNRFDGNFHPHNHFYCEECNSVLDLELDMIYIDRINRFAAEKFDGVIEASTTMFYGKCSDCLQQV